MAQIFHLCHLNNGHVGALREAPLPECEAKMAAKPLPNRELLEELETVKELADDEYMAGIAEASDDIRLGRTLSLEELDQKLRFPDDPRQTSV